MPSWPEFVAQVSERFWGGYGSWGGAVGRPTTDDRAVGGTGITPVRRTFSIT
jgi:hypothetical protein